MACQVCAEGSSTAVLDFNDTVAAVLLVSESQLTFRSLQLMHLAPVTAGYSSGSYYSSMSLLWPSINAAPGSKVTQLPPPTRQPASQPQARCGRGNRTRLLLHAMPLG